jgi:hypothetical protein
MTETAKYYESLMLSTMNLLIAGMCFALIIGVWKKAYAYKPLSYFFYFLLFETIILLLLKGFMWSVNEQYDYWKPFLKWTGISDTNFFFWFAFLNKFSFFALFYHHLIKRNEKDRLYIILAGCLALIILIQSFITKQFLAYSTFNQSSVSLFTMFTTGFFMYKTAMSHDKVALSKNAFFLISVAYFFSSSITMIMDLIGQKIYDEDIALFFKVSVIQNFILLGMYMVVAYAFYWTHLTKKLVN